MTKSVAPISTFRLMLIGLLIGSLSACALSPGNHSYSPGEQSEVKVPVQKGEDIIPENIKVKQISAELIIDMFKAARPNRPMGSGANTNPARGSQVDPAAQAINYRLGPGDIISIIVWDHPELTTPAGTFRTAEQAGTVVAEDGTIFYPYVGVIKVAGKTTREVRDILANKLAKYIEKVQIDVRMAQFRSKRVYVVGEVAKPGTQDITDIPMTVLEAVNRAGGFTAEADYSRVLLTRRGTTYRVDIQAMYEDGATEQNTLLEPGDILNVSDRSYNKIFVLGEVLKPGSMTMNKKRSTLAEALSDAGHINQDRASPRWIYVMRSDSDTPELFHLDGRSPDAMLLADRFPLKPRDIVYVDAADIIRWNRVISNILPTSNMLNLTSGTRYPLFGGRQ
ncbi:MAG TPA: polysaccharide export protein [Accumulibacter sp.]|nr:polysaccharide export protein [Accumulibacter sp.]HMW18972.1 polysaccharide export protein [Accumulibacter sp.]HND80959.1 polysaccharide export protein [Accumulibacter sp.]HNG38882.1 polysaccharide export protein [Accumulibacter sp.]HNK00823.1 polysaccharide export protein [Accumulibacter sp.]